MTIKTKKGNKERFSRGTVHVQEWKERADGSFVRLTNEARYMTIDEIRKYGPLLRSVCPNIKFAPD